MSATGKIDFEPGLFDESQPEAAPDLPAIQPKRRTNRAPFIVAGGLLLVLAVAFFVLNTTSKPKAVPAMPLEGPQTVIDAFSLPTIAKVARASKKPPKAILRAFAKAMRRCAPPAQPTGPPKHSPNWPLPCQTLKPNATG